MIKLTNGDNIFWNEQKGNTIFSLNSCYSQTWECVWGQVGGWQPTVLSRRRERESAITQKLHRRKKGFLPSLTFHLTWTFSPSPLMNKKQKGVCWAFYPPENCCTETFRDIWFHLHGHMSEMFSTHKHLGKMGYVTIYTLSLLVCG